MYISQNSGRFDHNAGDPNLMNNHIQNEYGEEIFNKSHGISSGLYTHEIASSPEQRIAAEEALERDQSQEFEGQSSHRHKNLLKLLMTGRMSLTFRIDLQTDEAIKRMKGVKERKVWELSQQLNHYDHLLQHKSDLLQGATANIFFTQFDPNNGGLDIQMPPSSSQGDSECQMPGGEISNIYDDELYGHELQPDGTNMMDDCWTQQHPPDSADPFGNSSTCMNNYKDASPNRPTFGPLGFIQRDPDDPHQDFEPLSDHQAP